MQCQFIKLILELGWKFNDWVTWTCNNMMLSMCDMCLEVLTCVQELFSERNYLKYMNELLQYLWCCGMKGNMVIFQSIVLINYVEIYIYYCMYYLSWSKGSWICILLYAAWVCQGEPTFVALSSVECRPAALKVVGLNPSGQHKNFRLWLSINRSSAAGRSHVT